MVKRIGENKIDIDHGGIAKKEAKLYMIIFHSSSERIESIHRE